MPLIKRGKRQDNRDALQVFIDEGIEYDIVNWPDHHTAHGHSGFVRGMQYNPNEHDEIKAAILKSRKKR